jgi:RimJ/RimL family protein N-acetyltransferase
MNLRKVKLSDLQELQVIGSETYLDHYRYLWKPGGVDWYINRCFGEEVLEKELRDGNIEYYIIENAGENIGMMKIVLKKALPNSDIENALYLEKIYFVSKWTGKGVGKETIEFVFRRAGELGRDCVWLKAMDTSLKPIAAYENAGFTIHSRAVLNNEFELMKEEFRGMVVMKNCFGGKGN